MKVNNSSYDVESMSGVPQDSILGPVLFSLHVREVEHIAHQHNFSIHMYADDIPVQCYFGFSNDTGTPKSVVIHRIQCFISDLKSWMNANFLKLNKLKTNFVEFVPFLKNSIKVIRGLNFSDNLPLSSSSSVKSLGVLMDDKFSLVNHINNVVSVCYSNLKNLGRIASKLSTKLKIQLIHSMILLHLDYCNALFYGLSQGSATPGTRAKSGTPKVLAWHAKRFHALANFKLLEFNKLAFESMSQFQCCEFESHSTIKVFLRRQDIYRREDYFFVCIEIFRSRTPTEMRTFFLLCTEIFKGK